MEKVDAVSGKGRYGSSVKGDSSAGRGVYSVGAGTSTMVEGGKYGVSQLLMLKLGSLVY